MIKHFWLLSAVRLVFTILITLSQTTALAADLSNILIAIWKIVLIFPKHNQTNKFEVMWLKILWNSLLPGGMLTSWCLIIVKCLPCGFRRLWAPAWPSLSNQEWIVSNWNILKVKTYILVNHFSCLMITYFPSGLHNLWKLTFLNLSIFIHHINPVRGAVVVARQPMETTQEID